MERSRSATAFLAIRPRLDGSVLLGRYSVASAQIVVRLPTFVTSTTWYVPSSHVIVELRCENTPSGLSYPGTTHVCSRYPVWWINCPPTTSHCACVASWSAP